MKQPLLHINKPQPPLIVEKLYSNVFWRIPQQQKTVYLTFDDGPVPVYTPWVLDILDSYNVKATFFCVGDNVIKYPEIFNSIIQRGHTVGSHTFNHLNGWKTLNTNYFENVCKAAQLVKSTLFRPPYGKITFKQARVLSEKLTIIMWDVLSKDYDQSIDGHTCFENVKNYISNGSIIVFHDSQKAFKNLEYALPKTIEWLIEQGFACSHLTID
ncbi:MAG: Peptidoglycan-N-acetylglucosamine deacetylase [Bacteroidetes bacterium ADurb.Bin217]|nr:MAG: Peptidoglycan-N-acetylglucosamine deacetylase [Bacteroidetes bacterium ADurb.Bin217]